jgi:hypothetical protein
MGRLVTVVNKDIRRYSMTEIVSCTFSLEWVIPDGTAGSR